ncbi:histamine N-methyltransferase A-like [Antedon mediterranea]|uniref:histamine N-methyltransferase A-like n=1 Tax=Antedon mediterranea TaxID=105859 RepID=UPI003AF78C87
MENSSTPLISNEKRYAESLDVYWKKSRIVEVLERWINSYFSETIMKEIKVEKEKELMVLGIGSGPGQIEYHVLKQVLKQWPKITDTVVEPNLSHINKYKDLAAKKARALDGVSFDWRQHTLQQFRLKTQDQPLKKFHFIMLFHVLYFFEDLAEDLNYLKSILEDGGMIIAMMECDDSCVPLITEQFPQFKKNVYVVSTRDVEKELVKLQIQFVKHRIQMNLNVTDCLDGESKEEELLVDFITQSPFFKETASKSLYSDIIEYLKSIVLPKSEDGKSFIKCDCDAIVITK